MYLLNFSWWVATEMWIAIKPGSYYKVMGIFLGMTSASKAYLPSK